MPLGLTTLENWASAGVAGGRACPMSTQETGAGCGQLTRGEIGPCTLGDAGLRGRVSAQLAVQGPQGLKDSEPGIQSLYLL